MKKWRDFIILIQNRIAELKDIEQNVTEYEEIYDRKLFSKLRIEILILPFEISTFFYIPLGMVEILEHLSQTITPAQLNAVLEPIIPEKDDTYWKYIMKAQQLSYANDVKELIINTSQQLVYSNSSY